ncbi:Bacterial type II secretion system protein F domain protein [Actinomadura rubteroloni]|uniref:Bacterial type II secretion system protein F domain protein n=1 Tax=Actinomadura rubteroloni TaxID=1926885 RepID=A0A2P4UJ24_9ACTN|nr:type II secretion system F family protein [Actinomadura rubteroloni]POM25059.1 Bacterial type II secretion system protein F domain protein [Actinomadura rubteroloni]
MIVLGFGLAAMACVALLVWGYALVSAGERVAESAVAAAPKPAKKADAFILNTLADIVGRPFTGLAMELLAPWRASIRKRIDAAGRPGGMTVESYARTTAGYVVIFAGVALLMVAIGQYAFAFVVLLGALQNEGLLRGRMNARQNDIQKSLPDFLDVLAVTVSAGLSFRVALTRVAGSMPGALADEFMIALRQMELGTSRREAFDDLRSRNSSEALASFVTALLQAEELGAPLQTALMDISSDMRRESSQWAKRKAQRTTPQITAVTTALSLPAVMLVVLGGMFFGTGASLGGFFGN